MSEETYSFNLPMDVPACPVCGMAMYLGASIQIDGEPSLEEISRAVLMEIARREEESIEAHYKSFHRFRWWLASRLHLKRALW